MRLVVIESPYSGNIARNVIYARECLAHSLDRGEAPIASHLLHTQPGVLDDTNPAEREKGILAGHAWIKYANILAVYDDYGITDGMKAGIKEAYRHRVFIEYREIL